MASTFPREEHSPIVEQSHETESSSPLTRAFVNIILLFFHWIFGKFEARPRQMERKIRQTLKWLDMMVVDWGHVIGSEHPGGVLVSKPMNSKRSF